MTIHKIDPVSTTVYIGGRSGVEMYVLVQREDGDFAMAQCDGGIGAWITNTNRDEVVGRAHRSDFKAEQRVITCIWSQDSHKSFGEFLDPVRPVTNPTTPSKESRPMKILITSGGTKIPIDRVRHIANMSKGTFGARITSAFLEDYRINACDEVIFLAAKGSKLPDVKSTRLTVHYYDTFWDYAGKLETLCKIDKPDMVILAAAVSDYEVENMVDGKIRTGDDLCIRLKPLPKLISSVRSWCPDRTMICGFKLLVDSTQAELVQAGIKSFYGNDLDMVVCNDLRDIKADNHTLHMIERSFTDDEDRGDFRVIVHSSKDSTSNMHLAEVVRDTCFYTYSARAGYLEAQA